MPDILHSLSAYFINSSDVFEFDSVKYRIIAVILTSRHKRGRNKTTYKNNRSGKQGVSFKNDSKSWKAKINNDGKEITRSFSIKKYGIDNAKERAVDWRKNKEQEFGYIGE